MHPGRIQLSTCRGELAQRLYESLAVRAGCPGYRAVQLPGSGLVTDGRCPHLRLSVAADRTRRQAGGLDRRANRAAVIDHRAGARPAAAVVTRDPPTLAQTIGARRIPTLARHPRSGRASSETAVGGRMGTLVARPRTPPARWPARSPHRLSARAVAHARLLSEHSAVASRCRHAPVQAGWRFSAKASAASTASAEARSSRCSASAYA